MRKMNRNEIFLFIKHNRNIIIRCCCCYCCRSGSILILCLILILSRICCITFFSFKDIIQSTYLRHSFYPLIRIPLFFSFKKGADKIKFDHHHIVVTYGLEFFLMVVVVKKKITLTCQPNFYPISFLHFFLQLGTIQNLPRKKNDYNHLLS